MDQTVAIIGNPNSGKTTLFNRLTGSHQKEGNWPGVTVALKTGYFETLAHPMTLVDLPGVYHLSVTDDSATDEKIALNYLNSGQAHAVINTIDATNLERNLYLTLQLQEMGLPLVVAVNMTDITDKRGIQLDLKGLAQALQCPVIDTSARRSSNLKALKQALDQQINQTPPQPKMSHLPQSIQTALPELMTRFSRSTCPSYAIALRLLEGDQWAHQRLSESEQHALAAWCTTKETEWGEEPDILIADARYQHINHWTQQYRVQKQKRRTFTELLDSIVLNRWLGLPIFLLVMYMMFFIAINLGSAFQDFFDISSHTLFVQAPSQGLTQWLPEPIVAVLTSGMGMGLNTVVTFIPVIGLMFLCLAFLEASGYMARASFVVDRAMQALGLPGKAFVPMIVGFGCNVPAVMAARTLQNSRDRILTILMTPFMSCGARLAIFAVFTAAFFPHNGANVVFLLYMIGILMAVITGFILRKTLLQGQHSPLIMELPPYHRPTIRNLLLDTWQRLHKFIIRAGKVIVPICIIVGTLNTITITGKITSQGRDHALLAQIGKTITPVFKPMGIQSDNWPATVGLATGTLAKEVVVGTLDSLYTQQLGHTTTEQPQSIAANLYAAWQSIPQNLTHLGKSLSNPIQSSAPVHQMSQSAYGQMHQQFGNQAAAFAYLLFVLLYFPCVSTIAATVRELNRGWGLFAMAWSTGLAYSTAVCFYQLATWRWHPLASSLWIGSVVLIVSSVIYGLHCVAASRSTFWGTASYNTQGG